MPITTTVLLIIVPTPGEWFNSRRPAGPSLSAEKCRSGSAVNPESATPDKNRHTLRFLLSIKELGLTGTLACSGLAHLSVPHPTDIVWSGRNNKITPLA
jgi:hypothetical protein